MSKEKLKDYDPSKYLETPEDIADFMQDAFESNDQKLMASAISVATKAREAHDIERTN
ncbi:DNA-binding protein [Vibrio sonorensis]|uniref:helix-turn-helix domain-containing transcriptional regulator n=1 Tax=Vibrio sonorensis TaxID=1004316 RepID=UPI001586BEDA|nr:hypothetical protein [Vibrio sonorensis]